MCSAGDAMCGGALQVAEDEIEPVDNLPRLESIPTASESDVKVRPRPAAHEPFWSLWVLF